MPEKTPTSDRVTCVHCRRSRRRSVMSERDGESWECKDEVDCSVHAVKSTP